MVDRVAMMGPQDVEERAVGHAVGLVQDQQRRDGRPGPSSSRTSTTAWIWLLGLGARGVDDVEQQVGLAGLFERGLERGDQRVRQVADEADRVGEQDLAAAPEPPLAGAGVERGEELVLDQDAGVGQGVHQGALAGVGVADERDGRARRPGRRPRAPCAPGSWRAWP